MPTRTVSVSPIVESATLAEWFAAQANSSSTSTAVSAADTSMTYAELDAQSNRWARRLIDSGIGPGQLVVVAVPRDAMLVVLLVAVVKSGAAYLPLETTQPSKRLASLLGDADPDMVLTTTRQFESVKDSTGPFLSILVDQEGIDEWDCAPVSDSERHRGLDPRDTAYTVYTSGSTGRPKAVLVSHRSALALFRQTHCLFGFDESDVWTFLHSCAFDFSVWEIWGALLTGGRLVVVDFPTSRSPERLRALVESENVTVLSITPSAFYQFAEADRMLVERETDRRLALRQIVFGGEALEPHRLTEWIGRYGDETPVLTNMYGITETTVHASYQRMTKAMVNEGALSVIGSALPGLDLHVLDTRLRPVRPGMEGEVYVAGQQVARGYAGRPGLTAERFVANPFSTAGGLMYRSGDVAWRDDDRRLVYVGRSDSQVQLRGHRIEPGEVEAALLARDGVVDAVVVVRPDRRLGDQLISYVVVRQGNAIDPIAVRNDLSGVLPAYMVPDIVMVLDAVPLTVNGKLDRGALPEPVAVSTRNYRQPQSNTECAVAEVFSDVLGVGRVGLDDVFFELGGNSLLAAAAVSELRMAIGVAVDVRWIMATPTPAGLASRIDAALGTESAMGVSASGLEVLFPFRLGTGPGVFFVHPLIGLSWSYIGLALALGTAGPVVGVQTPALTDEGWSPDTIEDVARRYIAEIQSIQPDGPYQLVGWSLGGVIAHCMATTLQDAGHEVSSLILMDSMLESDLQHFYGALVDAFSPLGVELSSEEAVNGLSTANAEKIASVVTAYVGPITATQVDRVFSAAVRSPNQVSNYTPAGFRGDILFLVASEERPDPDEILARWSGAATGAIVAEMVACKHNDMVSEEAVAVMAPIMAEWIGRHHRA